MSMDGREENEIEENKGRPRPRRLMLMSRRISNGQARMQKVTYD